MPPNCCTITLKFMPTASSQNREINVVQPPWEMCQNFQKTTQLLPLEIFAKRTVVQTIRNSYNMDCTFCLSFCALFSYCTKFKNPYSMTFSIGLYLASIYVPTLLAIRPGQSVQYDFLQCCPCYLDFCASLLPWNACPNSQKWLLSCCSKMLSLLLSQKNQPTTQEWVCPSTLIDLMR
jgi:hypothetical protein